LGYYETQTIGKVMSESDRRRVATQKRVLDVTCGGRMMWFNKNHPDALYLDRREVPVGTIEQQPGWCVAPDVVADFTDLPFEDDTFFLVVFDPPHIEMMNPSGIIAQKYGALLGDWRTEIRAGFDECMRVLKPSGVLIFKWGEASVPVSELVELFGVEPLFGHTTAKSGKTKWMTYMKEMTP